MTKNTFIEEELIYWKNIPGYPGYKISEHGAIYSMKRNRFLIPIKNWAGYLTIALVDENGFRSPRKVHRLVYATFIGKLENGKVIDHIDDNKYNNHYLNLQQITVSENSTKSFLSGKNSDKVVWSKDMIHQLCQMIEQNYTNKKMFEVLNVDYNSNRYNCNHLIGDLINNRIHQDVTVLYNLSGYIHGINKQDSKLSVSNVRCIYNALKNGQTPAMLAKRYSVTHSTICKIRDKKTWRAVTFDLDTDIISIGA